MVSKAKMSSFKQAEIPTRRHWAKAVGDVTAKIHVFEF